MQPRSILPKLPSNAYACNARCNIKVLLGMLPLSETRHVPVRPPLPATVATERCAVAAAPTATAAAATTTAATAAIATTTATTATEAAHLSETRVDLLVGLTEHVHEITSLLGVCDIVSKGSRWPGVQ